MISFFKVWNCVDPLLLKPEFHGLSRVISRESVVLPPKSKKEVKKQNKKDDKFWARLANRERCFSFLSRAWDKGKILIAHEETNLRAPMLYH